MKVEVLFPEVCNLYGDLQNVEYLKRCCDEIEIVNTPLNAKPRFLEEEIGLVYMGSTTEQGLELSLKTLSPYKGEIVAKIEAGQHLLFTGNALDILGTEIASDFNKDEPLKGLGILSTKTSYQMMRRHNSFFLGTFQDMKIVGFKSLFGHTDGTSDDGLFQVLRGVGRNETQNVEGFHYKNLYATYLIGPLFILNPPFAKYFLGELGLPATLAFEEASMESYEKRVEEFSQETRSFLYK